MERNPDDSELDFLFKCSNEELDPLVKVILDAATNFLDVDPDYKAYHPNHKKYVGAIIADIQLFGGNSVANLFRGHGVTYREILTDVCDNQDVSYSKYDSTEEIEQALLEKSLKSMWSKMSEEERREVLKDLSGGSQSIGGTSATALITLFRMGGFETYKVMLLLVNGLAKMLIGRGLTLGANALLTRSLAVVTGPIGWAVGGAWTIFDIASPAMRVTVPATVYIAALRGMKNTEKYAKEIGAKISGSMKKGAISRANVFDDLELSAGPKSETNNPHPAPADGSVEIYVGNLSYDMTEEQLREEFEAFGKVNVVRLITNRFNGKSKGFGFVKMPNRSEAEAAVAALNDKDIMGRKMKCNEAKNLI